jgi:hypothetical protein
MATFDNGNAQCQALGGHLPVVKTKIVSTFLANKFGGQIWMSLKTNRLKLTIYLCIIDLNSTYDYTMF